MIKVGIQFFGGRGGGSGMGSGAGSSRLSTAEIEGKTAARVLPSVERMRAEATEKANALKAPTGRSSAVVEVGDYTAVISKMRNVNPRNPQKNFYDIVIWGRDSERLRYVSRDSWGEAKKYVAENLPYLIGYYEERRNK